MKVYCTTCKTEIEVQNFRKNKKNYCSSCKNKKANCLYCKQDFFYPAKKEIRIFCCKKHYLLYKKEHLKDLKTIKCANKKCINTFLEKGDKKYCSISCSVAVQMKKKWENLRIEKLKIKKYCLNCNKEINNKNKFCDVSCSSTYNNIKRGERNLSEYLITAKLKLKDDIFECLVCSLKFKRVNHQKLPICFKCNPTFGESDLQKEIFSFISTFYKDTIQQRVRTLIKKREIDFYFPDLKVAIEVNGNYWHSEIGGDKSKNYHVEKTDMCLEKRIKLYQIFEDEWKLKKEIVKEKIRYILYDKDIEKIFARKCILKGITNSESRNFLNNHHTQGYVNSSFNVGAYYNDKLVSVLSISKRRWTSYDVQYELTRFATSGRCIGLFSKMLKYSIQKYNIKSIISYADRRWSTGNLYEKNGFKFMKNSPPNYWYVDRKNYMYRLARFGFRKSVLKDKLDNFNKNLSEYKNMIANGYDRIWDCGSSIYILKIE